MERTTAKPTLGCGVCARKRRMGSMEKQEIYQLIAEAKTALLPTHDDPEIRKVIATVKTVVTEDASRQYQKYAKLLFSYQESEQEGGKKISKNIDFSISADVVKSNVKSAGTKATLRKYARSVRHVAIHELHRLIKLVDDAQRSGDWEKVSVIVTDPSFKVLTELCKILPADYFEGWTPAAKYIKKDKNGDLKKNKNGEVIKPLDRPNSKKRSLAKLPKDWCEQMLALSKGQYRLPMLTCMLTGCRPHEVEKGMVFKKFGSVLAVHIKGAKVTAYAGQKSRTLQLPDNELKTELLKMLRFDEKGVAIVKVKYGNSITTHMRNLGQTLWPRRKESLTVYTARHAMASACKQAIFEGADPDLASKILGHIVDKTLSYYGNRYQAGGVNIVPTAVKVPKDVRHKSKERNIARRSNNKIPRIRSKIKFQPTF